MVDAARTPVLVGVGQSIEREEVVQAVELAARAARAAFEDAPGMRERIRRLTLVSVVFSPASRAAASEVAELLGLSGVEAELSSAGGNLPQWCVNRAAAQIAAGQLETSLIVGAEATRSMRAANPDASFMGASRGDAAGPADPVVGPELAPPTGAEIAAKLMLPAEVYPMLESARAHADGRSFAEQREMLGGLMSRFSHVAAKHPFAWFRDPYAPEEVSTPAPANRLIAEPYTKRMNSFPNVDQGSALILTSLAIAREVGLADQCVFPWSGATNAELAPPQRPDPGDSAALRAAASATLEGAGIGGDDLRFIDLYSCFPIAVQTGARALGAALDDARGLTLTGGMPFFGGPGNNYSGHAIATLVQTLRESPGLGYVGANGGYMSKHSMGVYACEPRDEGFVLADTSREQAEIDASALPVTAEADGDATVVASTVIYARDGSVDRAPVIATLEDGRRTIAHASDALRSGLAGQSLVGRRIRVSGSPAVYEI